VTASEDSAGSSQTESAKFLLAGPYKRAPSSASRSPDLRNRTSSWSLALLFSKFENREKTIMALEPLGSWRFASAAMAPNLAPHSELGSTARGTRTLAGARLQASINHSPKLHHVDHQRPQQKSREIRGLCSPPPLTSWPPPRPTSSPQPLPRTAGPSPQSIPSPPLPDMPGCLIPRKAPTFTRKRTPNWQHFAFTQLKAAIDTPSSPTSSTRRSTFSASSGDWGLPL
jgi:hypothetical protein